MRAKEVFELDGPVLLLAGPGTGKTTQLAKRLSYLINEKGVQPEEVTVVTFTAAAAQNMRDRISDEKESELYIPFSSQPKSISTMHSLGYQIIRDCAQELGLGADLRVINDNDLRSTLIEDAAQLVGQSREDAQETDSCRRFGGCTHTKSVKCTICDKYKEIMETCSAIDYDEQILLACDALASNAKIFEKYANAAKHLLVDEYQDINAAQHTLICLLARQEEKGLFVVGDDDQSIYSWRGGSPKYIRNFRKDFGRHAQVRVLRKSFRCTKHILEGAYNVVEKYDLKRVPKRGFVYQRKGESKILIHNTPSDEKEA